MHREALGEAWVLRQPVKAFYVHAAAPRTVDSPALELDVDPNPAGREVAGTAGACIVAPAAPVATWRATQFAKFRVGERGAVVSPDGVEPGLPMRVVDRTV
jgi:hypothetical protein